MGIRNHVLMLSGTLYANPTCERVAHMVQNTIPIVHPLGRCQIAPDLAQTFKTLVGHGLNPNAGAVIVVDHFKEQGCTADEIADEVAKTGKPVEVVNIRREGGAHQAPWRRPCGWPSSSTARSTRSSASGRRLSKLDLRLQLRHQRRDQRAGPQPLRRLGLRPRDRGRRPGPGRRDDRDDGRRRADQGQGQDARNRRKDPRLHPSRWKRASSPAASTSAAASPRATTSPAGSRRSRRKSLGAMQKWGTKPIVGAVGLRRPDRRRVGPVADGHARPRRREHHRHRRGRLAR